jgi:hypothetical protein
MSKQFPAEFQSIWQQPGIKAAFVSENAPLLPSDCENCGGLGFLSTFVASDGPFKSPSATGANHYDDGKWWKGSTYTAVCPVCHGAK